MSLRPEVETLAMDQSRPMLAVASMGRKERSAVVFMVKEVDFAIVCEILDRS